MPQASWRIQLRDKRVLITGASGFIGANLAHRLVSEGLRPHLLARETSSTWRISGLLDRAPLIRVDLRDKAGLAGAIRRLKPQVIFHTAAYGGSPAHRDADAIVETDLLGTINLVTSCQNEGFELLVNTGSSSEYGSKSAPMREDDALEPLTPYGVSKAAATLFCRMKAVREQLPIVTLRLFSPYGYYEESGRLIPVLILGCLRGENPRCASPDSVRDFIFIEDVIEAYLKAVERAEAARGMILNIGSGQQSSVGEVAREIVALSGAAVTPLWGASPNPRVEPAAWRADISRARALLEWRPRHTLAQGMEKSIRWFARNLPLYEKSAA